MSTKNTKKKISAVVVGLENLDSAEKIVENRAEKLNNNYKKGKTKQKIKRILLFFVAQIAFLATVVISLMQETQSSTIITFIYGFGFVILPIIFMISPDKKLLKEEEEMKNLPKYINYIKKQKDAFKILLEDKDQLIDVYLKPYDEDWIFYFVTLDKDENGNEKVKTFDIYVDKLKMIDQGKYSTFTIEKFNEEKSGYKIQLEISQDSFKELLSHS